MKDSWWLERSSSLRSGLSAKAKCYGFIHPGPPKGPLQRGLGDALKTEGDEAHGAPRFLGSRSGEDISVLRRVCSSMGFAEGTPDHGEGRHLVLDLGGSLRDLT